MSENTEDEPMEKNARIEVGKTPSQYSGKPSEMIKQGEAVTKDEEPNEGLIKIRDTNVKKFVFMPYSDDDDFDLI